MVQKPILLRRTRKERGAALVEFALISMLFFSLLLGIMEFGRLLFTWNSAAEATRWGARLAVVCDLNANAIMSRMEQIMPQLQDSNIGIDYVPAGCQPNESPYCQSVTVSIKDFSITPIIPIMNVTVPIPPFSTSLPRESMDSAGGSNPVCT